MKSWLRSKLINFLQDEEKVMLTKSHLGREVDIVDSDPVLNFRVFGAVGGKVVEFSYYDKKTDRRNSTTYIITNEQDFGERISKIATMESLKL
jgi:hypothetical protein